MSRPRRKRMARIRKSAQRIERAAYAMELSLLLVQETKSLAEAAHWHQLLTGSAPVIYSPKRNVIYMNVSGV